MNQRGLKRVTLKLIVISMIASMFFGVGLPKAAYAEEDTLNFSGGDGTLENPYKVATATELSHVNIPGAGAYFQQTANIDLGGWTPLGTFLGNYDGNGFTMENMTVNSSDSYVGLFSVLAGGASLTNIKLVNFTINATGGDSFVGGLVGHMEANSSVSNSSSNGSIPFTEPYFVGGLAGFNEGTITDGSSNVVITSGGNDFNAGGLVGRNSGNISGSSSSGSVMVNPYTGYAGGLVGINAGSIQDSKSSSAVTIGNASSAGGLVGNSLAGSSVDSSFSTGTVSGGENSVIGGLIGRNSGNISGSYSTGNASVGSSGMAGGLVGYKSGGTIDNSYSTGNAIGNGAVFVGGLVGMNQLGDVSNSYSTGSASGGTDANGGLIGFKQGTGTISNSYYLNTSAASSYGGSPRTDEEFMQQATFGSWNFNSVWRVAEGYAYPSLRWQPYSGKESTAFDYIDLTWDNIKGMNVAANEVTEDLNLPAIGPAGSTITWSVSESDLINPTTGKVTRATDDDHEVTLTATLSKSGGQTRIKPLLLTIKEAPNNKPNRKANVNATAVAKATQNTEYSINLSTIFEDADGDPLSYYVSVNGAAAITANTAYTYTPTAAGSVTLVFTASDGEELSSDTYTVELTVNTVPVRRAGTGATTEAVVMINMPYTLDLSTIFEDADADGLAYKVSVDSAAAVTAAENYTYTPTTAGTVTLVFTANDGTIDSTDTYTVELTANTAPVRQAGVDAAKEATVTVNTPYTLNLATIFEDTDGDELTYKVSVDGAAAVTAAQNYTYTPTTAGTVTLVFTANDGTIDSTDTYTVELTAKTVPIRQAGVDATKEVKVTVNTPFTLDLATIFEDTDGDGLTYKVSVNGAAAVTAAQNYTYTPTTAGTVTLIFTANDGFANSSDTYTVTLTVPQPNSNGSSGGGGGSSTVTPEYKVTISGEALPVKVDTAAGRAWISIEGTLAEKIFSGDKMTDVTMPVIPGVDVNTIEVPAEFLSSTQGAGGLLFKTQAGSISIPANMLNGIAGTEGKIAGITVGIGHKQELSAKVAAVVGDRPLLELTLTLNGIETPWNNPVAPVSISIPYMPTAEELEDPEHIVIWYIDGSGNAVSIPSGRYDTGSGTVTFVTTHFSSYAVAYVHKTFDDLGSVEWARKAVEVMASKGIISGTLAGSFAPTANITRADYLFLLVKTLGLTAKVEGNFSDVEANAYYYEALGIAKQLGLATGIGNNEYRPMDNISRQDMMVLTARALEKFRGLKAAANRAALEPYFDRKDIAGYAESSLTILVEEGLISGSGGKLNPLALTTRAEAAVFLYRIDNQY